MATVRCLAMVFDLDGTLIDSVYQHVLAWREALEEAGFYLAVWRIHRRIGMSGGLLVNALLREVGRQASSEEVMRLQQHHAMAYLRQFDQERPLPGASELLRTLARGALHCAEFDAARRGNRLIAAPCLLTQTSQIWQDATLLQKQLSQSLTQTGNFELLPGGAEIFCDPFHFLIGDFAVSRDPVEISRQRSQFLTQGRVLCC